MYKNNYSIRKLLISLLAITITSSVVAKELNGFNLSGSLIPVDEIFQGGPPRDGIPALNAPQFIPAHMNKNLQIDDYVMGIEIMGTSHAYPIRIMNWHEVVNDKINNKNIVVTYCPLCGSGMVFDASIYGKSLTFGVSGLLYNSDVLLYDKETQSLWSQLESRAVTGFYKGQKLESLPLQHTTWADWKNQFPQSKVLSFNTGFSRNYTRDPYAGYAETDQLFFPVKFRAHGIHPKQKVIGLVVDNKARAWPFNELQRNKGNLVDKLANKMITIEYNAESNTARINDKNGRLLPATTLFWFAWAAFHPDTTIYKYTEE